MQRTASDPPAAIGHGIVNSLKLDALDLLPPLQRQNLVCALVKCQQEAHPSRVVDMLVAKVRHIGLVPPFEIFQVFPSDTSVS